MSNSKLMAKVTPDVLAYYINTLTTGELKRLGFTEYTALHDNKPVLMLLVPFTWYFLLPENTPIQYISGRVAAFTYGITDSSEHFGALGFSIYYDPKKLIKFD